MHKVALFEIPNMHFKSQNRKKLQKNGGSGGGSGGWAGDSGGSGGGGGIYIRIEERKTLEGL